MGDGASGASSSVRAALAAGVVVGVCLGATAAWAALWQRLIVTFVDGKITSPDPSNEVCGCSKKSATFGDAWKRKVVIDAGKHYAAPSTGDGEVEAAGVCDACHGKPTRDKLSIRGVAA